METLYIAHATAIGGRGGHVETDDKNLSFALKDPKDGRGPFTNPEQLFACGYAACFGSALGAAAHKHNIDPKDITVTAQVSLLKDNSVGFRLAVQLDIMIPGMDYKALETLANRAHEICPYSRAIRGNVDVTLKVISA